ncbi:hypothetical protein GHT06_019327 [Daphnia sinensis]|uniref:Uncharacterized protein n=1 Tax=Daphnia sinensis TaxID=1820382 RepID=A0AAD5PSZ6_9CRUS|nr:hypothetical protein GHT06_019327 [Daphnia sinensis]
MTRNSCTWLHRDLIRHQTHRDFFEKEGPTEEEEEEKKEDKENNKILSSWDIEARLCMVTHVENIRRQPKLSAFLSVSEELILSGQQEVDLNMKPVEKMTYLELLEAQQRHKKILSNKSVLQKLPDKGKKLVETNLKIEERLQEYQTETEELSHMLSGMKITPSPRVDVNQMEWTGKIESANSQPELKANNQQPSPTEDSTDIVDILLTTNQMSKIVIDERASSTKADKSVDVQDPCYKRLTEKVENLKPNHQFKPYKTLKHEQDPSSKQHHSWDENTAATPPQWKHNEGIKPIAIEESLQLQIQAEEKLKALELHRYLPKSRSLHAVTIRPEELEEVYDEEPEGAGGGMAVIVHQESAD